jgi:hypothetical protein
MALVDTAEIGRKGGKARAKNLTPEQRSDSASKAAKARWGKRKGGAGKKKAKA